MNRYWSDHPPLAWMVAGYLGIKPKSASSAKPTETETSILSELPTRPREKVLTPEEYLAMKHTGENHVG